ncbi:hypothetical protein P43SY_006161 [Pythium insidiosum]|uniref:Inositol hexakisphosphate and diphosphoinositol-pentakisphosphate kinase n=1 Tax=Pythium insidiosum TaxID=114742 RepID=A0AAD5Q8Y6_PYTIN|nr:hypothetical protein P43SY_006161 [Pythium insidiosum]
MTSAETMTAIVDATATAIEYPQEQAGASAVASVHDEAGAEISTRPTTNEEKNVDVEDDDEQVAAYEDDDGAAETATPEEGKAVIAKFVVGVCAMDKKARSKPMKEILARLSPALFRVHVFGDETILHEPVEKWPQCDALIAFFSSGFPLEKAKEYVRLRNPLLVNDLDKQDLLMDRRDVYRILKENNIPLPRHVFMNRDGFRGDPPSELIEGDDYVEIDGVRIMKPFVEKPVDGEDHNIHIYYPTNAGGGCKKLFRKVGNRSSAFDPKLNTVRKTGSFIYEEFLSTQGTDVKVYTVGPNYAHAEARKSPVLDGRVLRDSDGKEVRYPVILSTKEKETARKVCRAFGQTICGFDILRVQDASYVCDVNGWSFVKNSERYYDDCATLLGKFLEQGLDGKVKDPFNWRLNSPTFRIPDGVAELSEPSTMVADEQRWQLCGINRKVQLKPKGTITVEGPTGKHIEKASRLLLILKWGGDLTHTGVEQAERLGQRFRQMMYPGGDGGLIRLHSTYRHDLKIYTSDEGRVQKTAASFAKGLLELEGDIIPILKCKRDSFARRYGRSDCPIKSPVGEEAKKWIEDIPELCYMTHFVVRVFERFQYAADDPQRFRLEISFSPGADQDPLSEIVNKHLEVAPLKIISREGLNCQELVDYFADAIKFAECNNKAKEARSSNQDTNNTASFDSLQVFSDDSSSVEISSDVSSDSAASLKRTGYLLSNNSSNDDDENELEPEEAVA